MEWLATNTCMKTKQDKRGKFFKNILIKLNNQNAKKIYKLSIEYPAHQSDDHIVLKGKT